MKRRLLAVMALVLTGASRPTERVVPIGAAVPVQVNGVEGRLRLDPGAGGLMLLGPGYADRAKLKRGGWFGIGVGYHVGSDVVWGSTAAARVSFDGGKPTGRRVAWTPRDYAAGFDAVLGPAGLDEPVVRFVLRPPVAGERTVAMEMPPRALLFASWYALDARVILDGEPVAVRFAPYGHRTIANAELARRLASRFGGRVSGAEHNEEIAFGISRPIRAMTLGRRFEVGPFALTEVGIRVEDPRNGGSASGSVDGLRSPVDPDEIVVTARSKRKPSPSRLTIGADELSLCSSMIFDEPAGHVRLSCLEAP